MAWTTLTSLSGAVIVVPRVAIFGADPATVGSPRGKLLRTDRAMLEAAAATMASGSGVVEIGRIVGTISWRNREERR